jgi:hypothetical protein
MKKLAVILCFLSATAQAADPFENVTGYQVIDAGLEVMFDAALLVDSHQTNTAADMNRSFTSNGYCDGLNCAVQEENRLLGPAPSHAKVRNYFLGVAAAHGAISYELPRYWREAFGVASATVEIKQILKNDGRGLGFSFRIPLR